MHDDRALRRVRDSAESRGDVRAEAFEKDEVHVARSRRGVGSRLGRRFHFGERLLVVVEEREVQDLDR